MLFREIARSLEEDQEAILLAPPGGSGGGREGGRGGGRGGGRAALDGGASGGWKKEEKDGEEGSKTSTGM
jgi:hypothetical protein